MKKFGFFAFFCGLCGAAWAAASIRASSVPLAGGTTVSTPKVTVSTISTTPDSDNAKPTSNPTNVDINTSRIAFTSPLAKTNRYYVPTSGSGGTTTHTSNTEQEIAAMQQQIDDLVRKQTQMQDNLPTTVQTAIKTSDLTKNDSFNDAISELQESVVSDSAIDSKINEKLVDKGIVDTGGNLQVATKDEIQPIPLSQKLESTLAVKFAKKSDYTPSKIATNIANDTAAVTTLSNRIGTDESTVKNIIKSDLQKRGIVDNNNQLQVATKDELPVIDTETVSAALQNTPAFDNLVTQNLTNRGIYDANNQLQLVKKSEITPDFLATKLDSKYAKTGDIATLSNRLSIIQDGDENTSGSIANKLKTAGFARTSDITAESLSQKLDNIYVRPSAITPTALSNKLANVFVTPTELSNKNFATKSELPQINEETVSAALRNSSILDDSITRNLKSKRILNDNAELNVATKSSVDSLSNNVSSVINTLATKNEVAALDNRFAKTTDVTADAIADKIARSDSAKQTLSGQIGPNTDQVNNIVTNKLKSTGILSNDNNETLQVATKDEINTTNAAISSVQNDITTLQTQTNTIANNQLTRTDVENAIKSVDLTTQNDTLKTKLAAMDAIDAKVITTDNADDVLKDKYASKMLEDSVAKLNADENTPGSIANKLQVATADLVKTSDITTEELGKKLDSKYASKTLESTVENMNGDITNQNSLLYKIKNNSEIRTALKGDTGAAYIPNLDDEGNLSWRDEKGAIITSLGTKNIRGQRGAAGADGATFIPALAADGTLSWTKGSANSELPTARNIKGADGATFIPAFDSATGKISWSRGTSGQTPDAIKIAKTDSELDTLVAGKISADTTIAKKTDLSEFAKTTDVFENGKLIASKLPSGVITESNLDTKLSAKKIVTDDNLGTKLGTLKVVTDDNIDSKLPTTVLRTGALTGYAKTTDIFDTDNKLIAAKLPSGVITDSNLDTKLSAKKIVTDDNLGTKLGTLKVVTDDNIDSKLPTTVLRTGALTGYAKTTDIFDTDNKLIAAKLPSGVITDSNLDTKLSAKKIVTDDNLGTKLGTLKVVTDDNIDSKLPTTVLRTGALSGYAKTSDIFDTDNKLIAAKLPSGVITSTNFDDVMTAKKLATTDDLPVVDETTINNALSKSTTLSGIIDDAVTGKGFLTDSDLTQDKLTQKLGSAYLTTSTLPSDIVRTSNGKIDTDILPSDVLKTGALTGYAKTSDLLDNNGILKTTTIPTNLVTSDALTTRLGGYATTSTVSDLTTRTASLESNALTADNLSAKLSAENSAVKQALSTAGFAQTGDITTTLNNTLNGTGEGSFASRLSSAGVITTGNIAEKLPTNVVTTTDGKIAEGILPTTVAKTTDLNGLVRTTDIFDSNNQLVASKLPSNVITTSNIATDNNVKAALSNATNNSLRDLGLVNVDSSTGAVTSKVITSDNIATQVSNNLPSNVVRTTNDGKIAASALPDTVVKTSDILDSNNKLKLALPDTVVTTSNIATDNNIKSALTNAGFAQSSDVSALATRTSTLETAAAKAITTDNLSDTTVKTALTNAGFAKTSDINSQVNNQALTMYDLSNILTQGILMVKSDGTLGLDPTKTSSGVGTKLSRVGNISNMTASTSIATSVAAATSAAVAADDINDATKCNSTDYMYWDTRNTKCLKCPADEPNITKFIGGSARCQCADPMTEFSVAGGICTKVSESQARCTQTENMYWNTKESGSCQKCPENSYYKGNTCLCQDDNMMLNTYEGRCMECPPESEYDPETRLCTCKNGNSINHEKWITDPAQACAR